METPELHLNYPECPKFEIAPQDGTFMPSTRVKNWKEFISIVNNEAFPNQNDEMIFRGQRHDSWRLTPTIARNTEKGTYKEEDSTKHLKRFKYSIRGRTKIPVAQMTEDTDIWALGQHHGLHTPLLDWSHSPFVALFFAMSEPNPKNERPKSHSRAIFCLNKSNLEKESDELKKNNPDRSFDELKKIFINPLSSEHERLINQNGLFTLSPSGSRGLEVEILSSLTHVFIWDISKYDTPLGSVDITKPDKLKDFMFKIYIPIKDDADRLECMRALRRMNIHHASLFPDLIGSSNHCNDLFSEMISEKNAHKE